MGCAVSCQLFESFSSSFQWILQKKLSVRHMSHILDDFMFFSSASSPKCKTYIETFLTLAAAINIPNKHQKIVQPSTCISLHGIEVDTIDMSLRLPMDKLSRACLKVKSMSKRKKTSMYNRQSLLGTLNFACRVIVSGRAFLRRLFDLTKACLTRNT